MSRRTLAAVWLAALAALLLAACAGGGEADGPEILYGQDICDRCRMVISEQRHAAGARLEGRDYRFDDPGCLRAFLEGEGPDGDGTAWVHDEAGSWRRIEEAWFVIDPEGGTPMASGILAFGSRDGAAAAAERHGGEPRRWAELAPSGAATNR